MIAFLLSPIGRKFALAGVLLVALFALYAYGNHNGRAHVQALWDEDRAATAIAANAAILKRLADNTASEAARTAVLQKTKETYEKQILDLGKRPHGGLYLPQTPGCNSLALPQASTDTSGITDPPGSARLPAGVEEDISSLIDKADAIRIRLTALQEVCK